MDAAVIDFIAELDAFLTRSGMTATALGREAVKDPSFVRDVKAGRAPSLRLVQRVRDFIRDHDEGALPQRGAA